MSEPLANRTRSVYVPADSVTPPVRPLARIALAAEHALERLDALAPGIQVNQERHQMLFRSIKVASQRLQVISKCIPWPPASLPRRRSQPRKVL